MEAVTARLVVLDKEVKDLGEKIEKLNAKLLEETDEKKEEKLRTQIKQQEDEKKELNARREKLEGQLTAGEPAMEALQKRLNLLNIERQFKPQSSSAPTVKQRQNRFRKSLIQVYQSAAIGQNGLWCMISGLWLPSDSVIAAQLLSRAQELDAQGRFDVPDIFDVRNGMLWCEPIEKAWTAGLLAILINGNGEYIFHVLTDELKQRSLASYSRKSPALYGSKTFGDLDGLPIAFPSHVSQRPFQRILLYCATLAVLLRDLTGDLSPSFQIDATLLSPSSPFDKEDRKRLEDWVMQTFPDDALIE